jgi:TrmH family RNA methyltransferase
MITSKDNQYVKLIKELSQKKKRDESGLYFLEGRKFISDLSDAGHTAELLAVTEQQSGCGIRAKETIVVSDAVMQSLSDTKTPQGMIGVYKKNLWPLDEFYDEKYLLYLDGVQDADNIGALIRTAVCAGFGGVLLGGGCADCYAPKAVRASAGAAARMKIRNSAPGELDLLSARGFRIAGAHLAGSEDRIPDAEKTVLVIGSEGGGISPDVYMKCDMYVRIPIYRACESLNAAVAGGLLMYKIIGFFK